MTIKKDEKCLEDVKARVPSGPQYEKIVKDLKVLKWIHHVAAERSRSAEMVVCAAFSG